MYYEPGISYGSCQAILTRYYGMKHVSAKFIPQPLTEQQKENYNFYLNTVFH